MSDALFELEHPPPMRPGARDYLEHLTQLTYRDDIRPAGTWTFWALAPIDPTWQEARPAADVDHVWLHDGRHHYQALIDLQDGTIYRRRQYQPDHDRQAREASGPT